MEGTRGGSSSATGTRIASVGSDVRFGQSYGRRPDRGYPGEQEALAVVPRLEYSD